MTVRSRLEPKPRVRRLTDGGTQTPHNKYYFINIRFHGIHTLLVSRTLALTWLFQLAVSYQQQELGQPV